MKKYLKIKNYISKKMSMSHIYQPVMLIEILKKNGSAAFIFRQHKTGAYHTAVQGGLVLTLSANDYVNTYVGDSGTSSGWQGSAHEYNYFTGFLVG